MSVFPPAYLESLRAEHEPDRWPGVLAADGGEALRERVDALLDPLPEPVRDEVVDALTDGTWKGALRGRATLQALSLARLAGCEPQGRYDEGILRLADGAGEPVALAVLSFPLPRDEVGDATALERLVEALEDALGDLRYILRLKAPMPAGFDPAPVARAVQLWLHAIARGEWSGRHAVYEDDDVSLEITLTGRRRSAPGRSLLFHVPPTPGMDRLQQVYGGLMHAVTAFDDLDRDVPLVAALVASPRWRLPRGLVTQVLYGTPRRVEAVVEPVDAGWTGTFRPNGLSLFSDPLSRRLNAMWWLERNGEDPLGFRAWAHENPWCDHPDRTPRFPGLRFAPEDAAPEKEARMSWSGRRPLAWSPA